MSRQAPSGIETGSLGLTDHLSLVHSAALPRDTKRVSLHLLSNDLQAVNAFIYTKSSQAHHGETREALQQVTEFVHEFASLRHSGKAK
jgi:hypothetical protein